MLCMWKCTRCAYIHVYVYISDHLIVCVVVVVCECEWVSVCRYVVLHEKAPTFNIGSVRINVNSHIHKLIFVCFTTIWKAPNLWKRWEITEWFSSNFSWEIRNFRKKNFSHKFKTSPIQLKPRVIRWHFPFYFYTFVGSNRKPMHSTQTNTTIIFLHKLI